MLEACPASREPPSEMPSLCHTFRLAWERLSVVAAFSLAAGVGFDAENTILLLFALPPVCTVCVYIIYVYNRFFVYFGKVMDQNASFRRL